MLTALGVSFLGGDPPAADDPPAITLTAPTGGDTVAGTVAVEADATDDNLVTQVEILVDGASIGVDTDGADGWGTSWDTTTAAEGAHQISATATDNAGQTATDSISVTVDNVPDQPPAGVVVSLSDGGSANLGRTWVGTVVASVTDADGPLAGITVSGSFAPSGTSPGDSCTTDAAGTCTLTTGELRKNSGSSTYTVVSLFDTAEGDRDRRLDRRSGFADRVQAVSGPVPAPTVPRKALLCAQRGAGRRFGGPGMVRRA